MIDWEGAELCFYLNGESHAITLSDTQFAIVAKILGLEISSDRSTLGYFSDKTLMNFATMKSNPLKLIEIAEGKKDRDR